jgi:hypothetical protein
MFSLRHIPSRVPRAQICKQCLRLSTRTIRPLSTSLTYPIRARSSSHILRTLPSSSRSFASKTPVDTLIESITEQYGTARDEFEIATEETDKNSTYAQADREAAREELDKLVEMYDAAVKGEGGEEVKGRIGGRIRELVAAVEALERKATEH